MPRATFHVTTVFTLLTSLLCGGCNTLEGAGQDIERAGEEIEEAARS